jgi:hypothetical protein
MYLGGLLMGSGDWSGEPFEETSRGPRGLRRVSFRTWERLYTLRPAGQATPDSVGSFAASQPLIPADMT